MKLAGLKWPATGAAVVVGAVLVWHFWPAPELDELEELAAGREWQRAQSGLQRYLRRQPDDSRALLLLARVRRGLGDYAGALEALRQVAASSALKSQAVFAEGELHWQLKRSAQAERCWQQTVQLERSTVGGAKAGVVSRLMLWSWGRLGDLYMLEGRDDEARQVLWELFESVPRHDFSAVDFLVQLTAFDIEEQNPQIAIEALEPCAAAEPDNLKVKAALMIYYLRAGKREQAARLAKRLAAASTSDRYVWESSVRYLIKTGDRAGLRRALHKLPPLPHHNLQSWHSRLWTYRGIDHENYGQIDQAVDCYRRAVSLQRRNREANARLAQALRLAGRQREFEEQKDLVSKTGHYVAELSHYLGRLPRYPGNSLRADQCQELARLCEGLGWRREAIAWHELALARQPGLADSQAALARLRAAE